MFLHLRPMLGAAVVFACSNGPTMPGRPSLEVVAVGERVAAAQINAHLFGSFRVAAGSENAKVITSGPANFPGHPKAGPGTCVSGSWYNAQGKQTSGTLARPHPHCISASAAIEIVLEPLSICYGLFPAPALPCKKSRDVPDLVTADLWITNPNSSNFVSLRGTTDGRSNPPLANTTVNGGPFVTYAIDAATLGSTNKRVGTLTIDPQEYASSLVNYVDYTVGDACSMDATIMAPCLNKVISAKYNPLPAPNGIGPTDYSVEGFLWVTPASSPYNYMDDFPYNCTQQLTEIVSHAGGIPQLIELGHVFTISDAQDICALALAGVLFEECSDRVAVIVGLRNGQGGDPCVSTA